MQPLLIKVCKQLSILQYFLSSRVNPCRIHYFFEHFFSNVITKYTGFFLYFVCDECNTVYSNMLIYWIGYPCLNSYVIATTNFLSDGLLAELL